MLKIKIGFSSEPCGAPPSSKSLKPEKSLVQVEFPGRSMALTYYNDHFSLRRGDRVYVEGALQGQLGTVTDVCRNFKIKLSDYKRVISVLDTDVRGCFHSVGSCFFTFDKNALPTHKVRPWFIAPDDGDCFISSFDGKDSFPLCDLGQMNIIGTAAERGKEYFNCGSVLYLSLDGRQGYAIVEGRKNYEVEFEYSAGIVSRLTCSCYCSGKCKHDFAVMLQLKELLTAIEKNYPVEYGNSGYFAALSRTTFFSYAFKSEYPGSIILD